MKNKQLINLNFPAKLKKNLRQMRSGYEEAIDALRDTDSTKNESKQERASRKLRH
jgi:hypothetical protein